ncbi:MAG: hypothetical protein QGI87_03780, partial [Candidatus Bathyarchaeota archaeon]|nr:hypothetical protein [Candidatus Bathyarchaeota archaeon]
MNRNADPCSRVHIVETLIGIFAVNHDNDIIERILYPRDAKQVNAALERHASGEPSREMSEMLEKLTQMGFKTVILSNEPLAYALRGTGMNVEVIK